jgi:hypothetical protein
MVKQYYIRESFTLNDTDFQCIYAQEIGCHSIASHINTRDSQIRIQKNGS